MDAHAKGPRHRQVFHVSAWPPLLVEGVSYLVYGPGYALHPVVAIPEARKKTKETRAAAVKRKTRHDGGAQFALSWADRVTHFPERSKHMPIGEDRETCFFFVDR